MSEFSKLNLLERRKLSIEELVKYNAELRKYDYGNGSKLEYINLRKKIHLLVDVILKIDEVLSKEDIVIINDEHIDSVSPKIYACTHIGGNDIQRTFQVIGKPAYLMLGDPGILYKKLIYQGLKLNGVIPLETKDKEDRVIAYKRCIELLNKGGNLLIYPEGAWNVSPNLIVMKLFTGTVRMAKETNVEIVPIACEQYDNKFYFNIGSNYKIDKTDTRTNQELTDDLREKLATLKWEIIESAEKLNNADKPSIDEFQNDIVDKCNYGYGFSLDDALSEAFHDKNVTDYMDVFGFLENLDINKDNAYLIKEKNELMRRKER